MLLKRILILLLFPTTCALAQDLTSAQANRPLKFVSQLEVFAGPSIVGMHGNPDYEKYGVTKIGYIGGVGVFSPLGKYSQLNIKAFFERRGFRQKTNSLIPPDFFNNPPTLNLPPIETITVGDINNNYLTLSVTPNYMLGRKRNIILSLGIYYSKLFKSQSILTFSQNGQVKLKDVSDQSSSYKDFDFGISGSIGYVFLISEKMKIKPQIQYNYGLINVLILKPGLSSTSNNSLALILAMLF